MRVRLRRGIVKLHGAAVGRRFNRVPLSNDPARTSRGDWSSVRVGNTSARLGAVAVMRRCGDARGSRATPSDPLPPPELCRSISGIEGGGRPVARPPPQPGELRYIAWAAA